MFDEKSGFGTLEGQTLRFSPLLQALRNSDGDGDGGADHRVVAHAQEAHHLHVRGHGGGTGKLGVGMHALHCVFVWDIEPEHDRRIYHGLARSCLAAQT